jgi:tetratricopeptide (TPR) repeat protein
MPDLARTDGDEILLFSEQKQYDKAKTALEMAIRTHPSYAVAHENLGDIYARMATQAYDRALQLDSSNTGAQSKLNLIREMVGNSSTKGSRPRGRAQLPPQLRRRRYRYPLPLRRRPAAATVASAKPAVPAKAPPAPLSHRSPYLHRHLLRCRPGSEAGRLRRLPAASRDRRSRRDAIKRTVEDWAAAWARKDVKAYLGSLRRRLRGTRRKVAQGMGNRKADRASPSRVTSM